MPVRYERLPVLLRGSPGAMGRFRPVTAWDFFPLLAACLAVALAVEYLRHFLDRL